MFVKVNIKYKNIFINFKNRVKTKRVINCSKKPIVMRITNTYLYLYTLYILYNKSLNVYNVQNELNYVRSWLYIIYYHLMLLFYLISKI